MSTLNRSIDLKYKERTYNPYKSQQRKCGQHISEIQGCMFESYVETIENIAVEAGV